MPIAWRQHLSQQGILSGRSSIHREVRLPKDKNLKCSRGLSDLSSASCPCATLHTESSYCMPNAGLVLQVKSKDGTTKFLLRLADNHVVETVGIPLDDSNKQRLTVCVSSQVTRQTLSSAPSISAHVSACLFGAQQPWGCSRMWTLLRLACLDGKPEVQRICTAMINVSRE